MSVISWDSGKEVVTLDLAHYDHLRDCVHALNELALMAKKGPITLDHVAVKEVQAGSGWWLRMTQGENMWQGYVSSIEEGIAFLRRQGD